MESHQPTSEAIYAVGRYQQARRFLYQFALACALFGIASLISSKFREPVPIGIACCFFGIAVWTLINYDRKAVYSAMVLLIITIVYQIMNFIHGLTAVGTTPIIDVTVSPFTAMAAGIAILWFDKGMAFHQAGLLAKPTRAAKRWLYDRANKAQTLGPRYTPNSFHFQTLIDPRSDWYKPWKGWLEEDLIVLVSGSSVWVLAPHELVFHEPKRLSLLGPKVTVQGRYYHGYRMDDYSQKNYTTWQKSHSAHGDVWVPHA